MSWINNTRRRWPVRVAAAVILTAMVAPMAFTGSARAEDRRGHERDWHHDRGWGGGYYHAPPVVYAAPYYAPPPVVYGPGFGLNINIR